MHIGIGARGTRLTYDKVLSEKSIQLLNLKPNEIKKLSPGIHRFSFAFVVPNVSTTHYYAAFLLICYIVYRRNN
jgi:hypothetical protein